MSLLRRSTRKNLVFYLYFKYLGDKASLYRDNNDSLGGFFYSSNRKSKNCATFYFKHMDTDTEVSDSSSRQVLIQPTADESSEEEWTYASARSTEIQVKKRLNFESDTDMKNDELNGNVIPEEENEVSNENNNGSDDEEACNKDSIAKLIREVRYNRRSIESSSII